MTNHNELKMRMDEAPPAPRAVSNLIFEHVRNHPGQSLGEIRQRLHISWSEVNIGMSVLLREGHVRFTEDAALFKTWYIA